MIKSGCHEVKVCFIFDESNILDINFLEKMNALLASGEVPGLFEGEEYQQLMHQIKEGFGWNTVENEEDLYKIFVKNVQRNLHIIFTMNPSN